MKIIDTRPIKNLEQAAEILNVPLYDIKALNQVINILKYQNIVFQSPFAVKNFKCIKKLNDKRIIAMGPGTSKELKKFGYIAEQPKSEFNSKGVISLMLKGDISGNTLVVKGEGGLSEISKYLNSASFKTDEINTYVRVPFKSYESLKDRFFQCSAVIFTSSLSVDLYFKYVFQKNENVIYLPISDRIKTSINSYGHKAKTINYFAEDLLEEIKTT